MSKEIEPVLQLASRQSTAIEINTSGWRKPVKEAYPSFDIMQKMYQYNVPVILGSDAHAPEEVAYNFDEALSLIKQAGYRKIVGYRKRKQYTIVL
jgi:histidinol-phosphatase (PHP family)